MKTPIILLHVLNAVIVALCIVVLGLVAHSAVLKDQLVPPSAKGIRGTGLGLLFWPGAGGIVDFILFLILLLLPTKAVPPTQSIKLRLPNPTLFVGTFITLRPLIVLIYEFVEHDKFLTVENWACAANSSALCGELRAARYLLIPILIFSAPLSAITLWVWMNAGTTASGTRDNPNAERSDVNTSTAAV